MVEAKEGVGGWEERNQLCSGFTKMTRIPPDLPKTLEISLSMGHELDGRRLPGLNVPLLLPGSG